MNFLKKRWKFFSVLLIELLLLSFAIGKCMTTDRYRMDFAGGDIVGYEQAIALDRGSYEVDITYYAEDDGVYCQTVCNTSYGVIMGEEIPLLKELEEKQFEVRLEEDAEMFFLSIADSGEDAEGDDRQKESAVLIEQVSIRETGQADSAHCLMLAVLFLVLDCVWILKKKRTWENLQPAQKSTILALAGIWFLASLPMFVNYMVTGDDFVFHMMRIEGIAKGLMSGQFPVKMQPGWMNGYGYPVSVMYGDALLYIPALLRVAGFTLQTSYKCYILVINGISVLSAYYCGKKITGERKHAVLGSLLFAMSAYRILNVYFRCSVGEYTAMAFFPLVFAGLHMVLYTQEKRKGALCLIGAYTLILQSHLLSCEMILLFSALYCVLQWKHFWKNLWKIVQAAIVTVILNLGFIVPFLDYMNCQDLWIKGGSSGNMQEHGIFVTQLFQTFAYGGVGSGSVSSGMAADMPISLGLVFLAVLMLFVWELLVHGRRIHSNEDADTWREQCSIFAMMLLAVWMSCYFFPWSAIEKLPLIGKALTVYQFAWRFLAMAVTLGSILGGIVIRNLRSLWNQESVRLAMLVVGLLSVIQGVWLIDSRMASAETIYVTDTAGMNTVYAVSGGEYLLQGAQREQTCNTDILGSDGVEIVSCLRDEIHFLITCENQSETEGWVKVPVFAYKGYRAYDAASGAEYQISFDEDRILKVILPAGYQGEVEIYFGEPMSWRAAELVSLLGLVLLLGWGGWQGRQKSPLRNLGHML